MRPVDTPPVLRRISRHVVHLGLFAPLLAAAQQAPDAGSLLREQPRVPKPEAARPATAPAARLPQTGLNASATRVTVQRFAFAGASLLPVEDLERFAAPLLGQPLSFDELQSLALQFVALYAERGYLARVFMAPQAFRDGVLTFTVVEGRLGGIRLADSAADARLDRERARRMVAARLEPGQPLALARLGEALGLLNQQPGVAATATLQPGPGEGEVDVALNLAPTARLSGYADLDNAGSHATGSTQGSVALMLNNATGLFDAASLLANSSGGADFFSADYGLAVGDRGLRAGATASRLSYRVKDEAFEVLQLNGRAQTFGLYASLPLLLRADRALMLRGDVQRRRLRDYSGALLIGARDVDVATLTAGGWFTPAGLAPISFTLGLSSGRVDLSGDAGSQAADGIGRRTQGRFTKLSATAEQTTPLAQDWALQARLRGQLSDRNLDSSERMTLGGPAGVRAYPVGEAYGDEGWLLNLDLVRKFGDRLAAKLFVDYGRIRNNHASWAGWDAGSPGLPNRYGLGGAGLGAEWRPTPIASLSAVLAAPLGRNPGRDAQGHDADGHSRGSRIWVRLQLAF